MLQVLSDGLTASCGSQPLRLANESLFQFDCCTSFDSFALGNKAEVDDSFWFAHATGIHLLDHAVFHHVIQICVFVLLFLKIDGGVQRIMVR